MPLPVTPPIAPMLAKLARTIPRGRFVYEPKWDGFRTLAFRDGDAVDLRSRHDRPLARYFPEIVEALRAMRSPRVVLDGEIVVTSGERLDFAALMARLHPAETRVERLRRETPATFVAFDLLADADDDLRSRPWRERRARLEAVIAGAPPHVAITPATEDADQASRWLDAFHGGGVDGVVAKDLERPYVAGARAMIKVKHGRTADCVVAGARRHGDRPVVGALLLGLYDADRLVHVGVASQFAARRREELAVELAPLATSIEGHPWERGFGLERSPLGRLAGAAGRWIPGEMALDWAPLRPERVCEVQVDVVDDRRFRHPARFVRWRPDRDPRSCTFDQLEEARGDVRALLSP